MAGSVLASLTTAGIIERPRNRGTLRVTPRFLSHTQATAHRVATSPRAAIADALATWGVQQPAHAVDVIASIMDQHGMSAPSALAFAA